MTTPLGRLSDGALDWLGKNLDHFDPFSSGAGAATHAKAKAALELALLCHCAARLPDSPGPPAGAGALVRTLWEHPGFPGLFDAHPGHASVYGLVYAALAPDGIDPAPLRATLARLDPQFLSPRGKTVHQRIEIRYYADKAGVRHGIEPYTALVRHSPPATLRAREPENGPPEGGEQEAGPPEDGAPLTTPQAYALTHSAFYLGDFGHRDPGLTGTARTHARDLVRRTLDHCVEHDRWDLAAELVLTQFVLGADPSRTPSGAAAVECLARAQRPDGAIPGRSAALAAVESDTPGEFFRRAYHTTLVTALMALVVPSARAA